MKTFPIWLLTFFIAFSALECAAPATHIHSAELWMRSYPFEEEEEQMAFIAGTLFPDIRYLGSISRQETHEEGVTASKIRKTSNAFIAGKRLHAFVDEKRETFVKKCKVYSHLKKISKKERVLFLKLLEDEILWDRTDTVFAGKALSKVYPEEIKTGLSQEDIELWHQTMIDCFTIRPSDFLHALSKEDKGFLKANAKTVKEWSDLIPVFANDPYFVQYVEDLLDYLEAQYQK